MTCSWLLPYSKRYQAACLIYHLHGGTENCSLCTVKISHPIHVCNTPEPQCIGEADDRGSHDQHSCNYLAQAANVENVLIPLLATILTRVQAVTSCCLCLTNQVRSQVCKWSTTMSKRILENSGGDKSNPRRYQAINRRATYALHKAQLLPECYWPRKPLYSKQTV